MKIKITAILACLTFVFLFAGCQSTPKDQAESTTTQDIATTAKGTEKATEKSTATQTTTSDTPDFSKYETKILKITKKIQAAKPASNASKNQDKFYSLKKELDAIDHELDTLDDDYEHQYDTGKLSAEKYKDIERKIDALEDKLDFAEDSLENKFGIDD